MGVFNDSVILYASTAEREDAVAFFVVLLPHFHIKKRVGDASSYSGIKVVLIDKKSIVSSKNAHSACVCAFFFVPLRGILAKDMLTHLHIRNYALISHLDIDFHEGFSVMTGETGAGKSIILGALNLVMGARADIKSITEGEDKCVIEALFRPSSTVRSQIASLLDRS